MKEKKPRVLVILDNDFNPDIRVQNEIVALIEVGFEITLLCFGYVGKNYPPKDNQSLNIIRVGITKSKKDKLFFLASWLPFYSNFWVNHIGKVLTKQSFDLIYTHDLQMARPVSKALKKSGKKMPFVLDLHEHLPAAMESYSWTKGIVRKQLSRPWIWYKREKNDLLLPDLVLTLSASFAARLAKITNRPIENFHEFANITPSREANEVDIKFPFDKNNHTIFFYYGGIADRRGIFDAISGFNEIAGDYPQARLLLIGPVDKSDLSRFSEEISSSEFSENIVHIPWIDQSLWINYANECHFCLAPFHVNPQHNSGVANKIFQYIQAGKYIIASDCTPQKNVIEKYSAGVIFKSQSEFIEAYKECLENRDKLIQQGLTAATKFNADKVYEHNIASYQDKISSLVTF